jgi:hypothetical protein
MPKIIRCEIGVKKQIFGKRRKKNELPDARIDIKRGGERGERETQKVRDAGSGGVRHVRRRRRRRGAKRRPNFFV